MLGAVGSQGRGPGLAGALGKKEHVSDGRKGFPEMTTAQRSPDVWKAGEASVDKVFPGQEVSEPRACWGESKVGPCTLPTPPPPGCLQCRCLGPT